MHISALSIHSFRGIPHDLTLDLKSESTGKPVSMILFGDNGTGKSSVTDAIEFALQARIRGGKSLTQFATSAISFACADLPSVQVLLADGTTVERAIIHDEVAENGLRWSHTKPHSKYNAVPFVLRRADILRFMDTPDNQRQLIFYDYFRTSMLGEWAETPSEAEVKLNQERTEEKAKRRELLDQFARRLGITEPIPPNGSLFEQLVHERVYGGLSKVDRERALRKGIRLRTDIEAKRLADAIRESSKSIGFINKQLSDLSKFSASSPRDTFKKTLEDVFVKVGKRLTQAFQEISTSNFVDHIELVQGDVSEVALSLKVHLQNGRVCSPKEVFSEANLDLLALLVFLSVAQEASERGQAKFLILDDVFQSVDATIRFSVVDYIFREFQDWQIVCTVHDRLWQAQLRDLCRRHNHPVVEKEIIRWKFDSGPTILGARRNIDEPLLEGLNRGDICGICAQAGLLLEEICNRLSWTLPISVTRRKDDKYTLGDLWPGVYKALRKTSCKVIADDVDKWMHLRNLVGAHYNEWARSLSNHEAVSFGEAVIHLLWEVKCDKCFRWIESSSNQNDAWSCRCKKVKLERKQG